LIPHPLGGAYAGSDDQRADETRSDAGEQRADLDEFGSLVHALETLRTRNSSSPPPVVASVPEPVPSPVPAPPKHDAEAAAGIAVSDALVDEVARRVIERLAPDAVNEVVTDIVTRVAERLLREEIARLK
jgi:hypothetical protein